MGAYSRGEGLNRGGLIRGGTYTRGAYKIIVDIKKTLQKDLEIFL